ncbi:hypothetical protein [Streptomyces sp. NPDC005209]|uniref:hypothetical protein n=1 Tax=Streptomyces sp. NPDC005209 TaxID=3156715 RepID=UPI0033B945A7
MFAQVRGSDAHRLLLDAAHRLAPLDAALARDTLLEALGAAIFAGRLSVGAWLREVAEAARADLGGRFGYVWANQPAAASYTPSPTYQFNSAGSVNTITRSGVGQYTVRLPSIGSAAGHVQVTAYGDVLARCKTVNWYPSGTAQLVNVRCFTFGGSPRDTQFTLTYTRGTGLLRATPAAYAWANQPTTASYTPATAYQYNSAGYANRITRQGVGVYRVWTPGMALGYGDVQVTAYGLDSRYCKVDYWTPSTGIQVRCFSTVGAPADTYFDVSFVR